MRPLSSLLLGLALCASAGAAYATPTLRQDVAIASDIVRIGDLVAGAGALSDIAVFRAPDLGHVGTVATGQVLAALRRHGLNDVEVRGVDAITVTRLSRRFTAEDVERRILSAFAGQAGLGAADDLSLTADQEIRSFEADPSSGDLVVVSAQYDPRTRRFDVLLAADGGTTPNRVRYTGTLLETAPSVVLVRPVARGDIIRASDVVVERRARTRVPAGAIVSPDQIVGKAARRPLTAGQPLRPADLMKPELVHQNETVTVVYETGGLSLSVRGKALESGAEGDVVNVLNIQSKRTIQGTVVGPGRVSAIVMTPRVIASAQSNRAALAAAPQAE